MNYQKTLLHLHVIQIEHPMTGGHTTIALNLNSRTSYSLATRCQPGILIFYSASGLRLLLPTTTNRHCPEPRICTRRSMKLRLVKSHGNPSHYSLMELEWRAMSESRRGWDLVMISGSGTLVFSFTTFCPIPISKVELIWRPFKNAHLMERIDFNISCLGYGPGDKQQVFSSSLMM
jgi:hypothetical protein